MASYVNPLHRDPHHRRNPSHHRDNHHHPHHNSHHSSDHGLEHIDLAYEPYMYDNDKALFEMESLSDRGAGGNGGSDKVNIFIVFVFILELLVLVFVSVLEYFLRDTDVFPVRQLNFSCNDPDISYVKGSETYDDFAYNADVSYDVIVPLCFCLPPFLILISEIALWAFTDEPQKTVRALCKPCKVPQVFRRMFRYIGTFLFGLLITMIFVDVTKLFVGRLRPTFLEICNPDPTKCTDGHTNDESVCRETDDMKIRDGRLSFPSLMAAMTSFSATFLAIYLHNIVRTPSVRVMRPFLALGFIILAVMCALARYGLRYNHWTDAMVGFGLGIIMAIYVCVWVLNEFRERLSSQRLYQRLRNFMAEQRALELRDFYKENWAGAGYVIENPAGPISPRPSGRVEERLDRNGYMTYPPPAGQSAGIDAYSMTIPRPHVTPAGGHINESTTDIEFPVLPSRDPPGAHITHSPSSEPGLYRSGGPQKRAPQQNTFQRDLNRALYQYNRQPPTGNPYGHI